jgi:hypothetical protein
MTKRVAVFATVLNSFYTQTMKNDRRKAMTRSLGMDWGALMETPPLG